MHFAFDTPAIDPWRRGFDPTAYREVPDDWVLFVADVVGSTAMARAGQVEALTYLSTAGIAAAANALGGWPLSYFGGDGWQLAIAPQNAPAVLSAMRGVVDLARSDYGVTLRYAAAQAADCPPLYVARVGYPGASSWLFRGDGFRYLERMARTASGGLPETGAADLAGLTCRWAPIPAQHGVMFSFLARSNFDAQEARDQAHDQVLQALRPFARPPNPELTMPRVRWLRPLNVLLAGWRRQMAARVVGLQIDDGLAATLDVSVAEADAIDALLRSLAGDLKLTFGTSRAESARMMCYNRSMSEHLHFCDAAVGAYWDAATDMKDRKAQAGS